MIDRDIDTHCPTGASKEEIILWWQDQLDIEFGMSKEEASEKFRFLRDKKKTCQRCECDNYFQFCPIHLICQEANNERDVEGDDNRSGIIETDESKTLRTEVFEKRKRASLR